MPLTQGWPRQMESRLRELWAEGLTGSQIARELSWEFRVSITRNAVIGRAHRLKLAKRASPIKDRTVDGKNHNLKTRAGWRKPRGDKSPHETKPMSHPKPPRQMPNPYGHATRPSAPTMPAAAQGESVERVSLEVAQEGGGCRWPTGTRPYEFCGQPRARSHLPWHADPHPYCSFHDAKGRPA